MAADLQFKHIGCHMRYVIFVLLLVSCGEKEGISECQKKCYPNSSKGKVINSPGHCFCDLTIKVVH